MTIRSTLKPLIGLWDMRDSSDALSLDDHLRRMLATGDWHSMPKIGEVGFDKTNPEHLAASLARGYADHINVTGSVEDIPGDLIPWHWQQTILIH